MFDVELMSPSLCVLECTAVTLIEFCLSNQNGCGALCTVPQATCGSGCVVFEETPSTIAPHPFTAYKYRHLP
jgi:hypothetical protein